MHHAAHGTDWHLPETMGAGLALIDLDGDGDLDLLLLDTGSPPGSATRVAPASQSWLNTSGQRRPLRLVQAHAPPPLSGLAAMGACTGDVDGDGHDDAYVTGLPAGRLLLGSSAGLVASPGNGGIADPGWGTSCVLFDRDLDGDLDLYVAHYVRWSAAGEPRCGGEVPGFASYCPPDRYRPEQDRLFVNDGHGRFTDGSAQAGLGSDRGNGLGVVAADFDGDGYQDLYVANDQTPSALLLSRREAFRDVGLASGTALSEDGRAQAGMGVDAGDVDGDGRLDITKTNLDLDANNLYLGLPLREGVPRFRDAADVSGLAGPSFMKLGFGTVMADLDSDGDLDIAVANGHILPDIARIRPDQTYAMEDLIFENLGVPSPGSPPALSDARASWLPAAAARGVSRGLAVGDLDDDGDLDLVETRNDGPARILLNTTDPPRWVGFVLGATLSAPGAPGARVTLHDGVQCWTALRRTGGSYLSASDDRMLFALPGGARGLVTADVEWPSGRFERFEDLPPDAYLRLVEGTGKVP